MSGIRSQAYQQALCKLNKPYKHEKPNKPNKPKNSVVSAGIRSYVLIDGCPHRDYSHPSLHTELLEPKQRRIYSFRLDRKYRAIFIYQPKDKVEIIAVTKHYRK